MSDVRNALRRAAEQVRAQPDALQAVTRRVRSRQRHRRAGATACGLVLTGAAMWFAWRVFDQESSAPAPATGARESIVFTMQRPEDPTGMLAVMSADGSNVRVLGPGSMPAWSPDGRRIAFSRTTADGNSGIFVMNNDGGGVTRLTRNSGGLDEQPSWSPDGRSLVFSRLIWVSTSPDPVTSRARRDIYIASVDGGSASKLLDGPTDDFAAQWSPDGNQIAFVRIQNPEASGADAVPQVWIAGAEGSDPRPATNVKGGVFGFDWSGDGRAFVFSTGCRLYVLELETRTLTRISLSMRVGCPSDPSWSPDGKRFVFTGGHRDLSLYLANRDGTEVEQITGPGSTEVDASWAGFDLSSAAAADPPLLSSDNIGT
jgi:Tol biopolymer transport system component